MNDPARPDALPPMPAPLPEGRLEGRAAFQDAVRTAMAAAEAQGWPQLVLCDPDFLDWPLGERAVVEALDAWARRGRTLRLLAADFSRLREAHPRFLRWRTTWGHLVEAHVCPHAPDHELPTALWTPTWTLECLDPVHFTAVATTAADRRVALSERLMGWWRRGTPGFPATTIGL